MKLIFLVNLLYLDIGEGSEAKICTGQRKSCTKHCVKTSASYSLYSRRTSTVNRKRFQGSIPPSQGSSLSQDSSPNRTPGENCYISGYKGTNEISQYFLDREWILISLVNVSDPKDETGTRGSPYNFAMLNNPETGHLGKMLISPNW